MSPFGSYRSLIKRSQCSNEDIRTANGASARKAFIPRSAFGINGEIIVEIARGRNYELAGRVSLA